MAIDWKVVRIADSVLDGLQDVRTSMARAHETGHLDVPQTRHGNITDNEVIRYLISHYQRHRERRRRSQRACRYRRQCAAQARASSVGLVVSDG